MELSKKEKKQKSKSRRVIDALFTLFFIGLCICFATVFAQIGRGQQPNLFGYSLVTVQTGSMEGSNDFYEGKNYKITRCNTGDVLIEKIVKEKDLNKIEVGDVISYHGTIYLGGTPIETSITHRVIGIDKDNRLIIVQGDANPTADDPVSYDDVIAVVKRNSVTFKLIYKTVSSFWGFAILIFIPMLIMLILQIYQMLLQRKTEKLEEENKKRLTSEYEEKKKALEEEAIKEYLASLENKIEK